MPVKVLMLGVQVKVKIALDFEFYSLAHEYIVNNLAIRDLPEIL
jgi:hypothetical protein